MDTLKKISVVIDNKTISNKNSAETFVYSINHLSNKVGKEILYKDFPKVFSKSKFFWGKTIREDRKVGQSVDDSGEYYIFTNTNTERKKSTLEHLYKNYNIDIDVSIIEELIEDEILSNIKKIFQENSNTPMTSEEISYKLKKKEYKINEILFLSDFFDKITTDKTRYRLSNYLPTKLVDSIKSYDFVTIDMLIEILGKNGMNVNI
jgi:hypothetical protein